MLGFQFGFVRRGACDAGLCVTVELITRIERNGQRLSKFSGGLTNKLRSDNSKTVIRNGQSISAPQTRRKFLLNLFANSLRQTCLWFVVEPENLLRNGVSPAGQ